MYEVFCTHMFLNNTDTQLNISNFKSHHGLIYLYLTSQTEAMTKDPKQLIFCY